MTDLPDPAPSRAGRRTPGRPDASMTLIRAMLERPLDPGYAAAADRREAAGLPRATTLRSPLLAGAVLVIGLVVGVAASNLTAADSPRAAARADLIQQITARRTQVDQLSAQAQTLQADLTAREASRLGDQGELARGRSLAIAVGALPMEGPGMTVTLDDAPDADQATGTDAGEKRGFSRDVQIVVNALWQAGAEAISINGMRLTSLSEIRFAGSAIVVGHRALNRPYVVTALGPPRDLPGDFADGPGGTYISTLHSTFGIRADTEVSQRLTVPAASRLTTRYAQPMDTGSPGTPSPSATTSTETGGSAS
jgi:uncharacterized protein YlxW (UPF0749 family)